MYKLVASYNKLQTPMSYESYEEACKAAEEAISPPNPEEVETWQGMGMEQPEEVMVVEVKKSFTKKVEYDVEEF